MRNCTTKLMSVTYVTASTHRNVARIDTAATSSGTSAMNEAKTNSRMTRAPGRPEQRLAQHAGRLGSLLGLVALGQLEVARSSSTSKPGGRRLLLEQRLGDAERRARSRSR
jgi:hypothetical protein